jgi:hypothetical protein
LNFEQDEAFFYLLHQNHAEETKQSLYLSQLQRAISVASSTSQAEESLP